ncbi:mannose-6-phosphate isomerase, class I [Pullulanibacillus sp. KACC 23026]|uniref:mannose-6-phosphate isomerase, class I n=1 Tax=Pullulanibacillus sp. KACC 23026 TaxID=3028315 RepID=UPI0023B16966|nr:mannose-6-phosphate isomerase, class I [Pullulanibacillus sp. KACC 23026]WEG13154.1 mannose-6-phosphate isomerase, class I [Pullulanibacillus sp. KACC 23026]
MAEPLYLKPVFKERIWGGDRLRDRFNYEIPTQQTGECWGISAHPHGPCEILNGRFKGYTLDQLWTSHPELFGQDPSKEFPLLTKILDAKTDLSVQVHPNDEQAQEMEQTPFGKTECWYIIDAEPGAEIVYGHHAGTPEEFRQKVEEGKWEDLLRKIPVKPGDFFYVPSGTIHAIGGGILILETQQSSDVTYRVYDYDRRDQTGKPRELHIEPSIAVTRFPHSDPEISGKTIKREGASFTEFVRERYFTVTKVDLEGEVSFPKEAAYLLFSVLDGEGQLENGNEKYPFKKGDHFIVPATIHEFKLKGKAQLIVSHP